MKLVKVKPEYYKLLKTKQADQEIMENETGRPCVLLVDLIYRGRKREHHGVHYVINIP